MLKVKDLPFDDRPREKLILKGPQSLSDSELIAILLRTGTKGKSVVELAQMLLNEDNLAILATRSVESFTKSNGIGKDKAATIAAAFELARRVKISEKWFSKKKITSPQDVAEIFIPLLRDEIKEKFIVVCLNSSNQIIKFETISIGNLNSSIVHPREVFKVAIDNNSANIFLVHNHPSGNLEPSREDIQITKKLVDAGNIFDIKILDHLIIGGEAYTSFVERRII
ncbi:MAG: DNA repair protein RadC [Ignavibacteriales bacterium]|nr:DNA repair protein RadC [Ignavibacteriales bacterium]MCB9210820.1 DNA repair protein RadC [Ignavibacteriales bacterium]MCB9217884.1 DNA repair protein RadC [Ignavibacteriales bacterium]